MLPYRTVLTLACVVLAVRYVLDTNASIRGRAILGAVVVGSFSLPDSVNGQVIGILAQLAVSLFVLLRLKVMASAP
jgi:hypothetical protein